MSRGLRRFTLMMLILSMGVAMGTYMSAGSIKCIGGALAVLWLFNLAEDTWESGRNRKRSV